MCPRLTELTVIFPHLHWAQHKKMRLLLDQGEKARSAISELVGACKALPDFDTLQTVRFPIIPSYLVCWCGRAECDCNWKLESKRQTKDLDKWVIDCLKESNMGCREGEGKRTMLRVIKFGSGHPCQTSVAVEEYEMQGFDGS